MTNTITDMEDSLVDDLERAEATIADIEKICRNADQYDTRTLVAMILQRINRIDTPRKDK